MDDSSIKFDQNEDEVLTHEVSDEMLETAVGTGIAKMANYTLSFCTTLYLSVRGPEIEGRGEGIEALCSD